jgi:hypothetical protein
MTVITGNRQLAARARDLAGRAPSGSLDRRAALCVAVLLGTTKTAAGARQALSKIDQADIRTRAETLLGELEDT